MNLGVEGELLPLFLMMGVGYFMGKHTFPSVHFRKDLIEFCFLVVFPASVIHAFDFTLSSDSLSQGGKLIVVGFLWIVVPFLLALLFTKVFKIETKRANVMIFALTFGNLGFAGMGIISSIYGAEGLFFTTLIAIFYRMTLVPVGSVIMQFGSEEMKGLGVGGVLKQIFLNPTMIALLVMLPTIFFNFRYPAVIYSTANLFNGCLAPIGMLVTGMAVSDYKMKELFSGFSCYVISVFRLLIIPVITGIFMSICGIKGVAFDSSFLIIGMPVAANCTILSQKFNADTRLGAQCVLISTLLSILTLPLLMMLGLSISSMF